MKKGILFAVLMLATVSMGAQTTLKAQSLYDVNQDNQVSISDVNTVAKKVLENATTDKTVVDTEALLEVLNALNAKIDKLENNQKLIKQKLGLDPNEEYVDPDAVNLLPGKFTVAEGKQVQFTKANLYWDGNDFKLEANQTDYPTEWNANHVSHFCWTNLTDYQSGNASYMPYAESYNCSSWSTSDKFWCGEDNTLTVDGTDGLYALTGGSSGEWKYLINSRTNASNLYKYGVTVTNGGTSYSNCLIIAPDDYTETLKSSYTLDEVNAAGLVCLPAAGCRDGSSFNYGGSYGYYWSATPDSSYSSLAYYLYFFSSGIFPAYYGGRYYGQSLRLVRGIR